MGYLWPSCAWSATNTADVTSPSKIPAGVASACRSNGPTVRHRPCRRRWTGRRSESPSGASAPWPALSRSPSPENLTPQRQFRHLGRKLSKRPPRPSAPPVEWSAPSRTVQRDLLGALASLLRKALRPRAEGADEREDPADASRSSRDRVSAPVDPQAGARAPARATGWISTDDASRHRPDGVPRARELQLRPRRRRTRAGRDLGSAPMGRGPGARGSSG